MRRLWLGAGIGATALLAGCFSYRWESKGPFEMSGVIRHLAIDPTNPHRLYAAAENGGLWVLEDEQHPENGWRPLSDQLENLQMRGIALSSIDPKYIVTANAAGFVYHSKDGGASWQRITNQNFSYIRRLLIAEGLTQIPAGNYTRLAKETRIWVAGKLGLFLVRLVNDQLDSVQQIYPQKPGQKTDVLDAVRNPLNGDLYVGARRQGVWKRPEGPADPADAWTLSADWATFGVDDAQHSQMIKLAITPTGSRIAVKLGNRVLVNDSGGDAAGWVATEDPPFLVDDPPREEFGGEDFGYRGNYNGRTGEWHHAIAISPADNNLIAVGQAGLLATRTGGQPGPFGAPAWSTQNVGHEDMQSLVFSPSGDALFVANDGGVFRVPTSLGSIVDLNAKLATSQFYRIGLNGKRAVGNADHQGIWGTRDIDAEPVHWERATPSGNGFGNNGLENDFVSADPKTAGRFFVQFQNEHLLRLKFPGTGATADLLPVNPTSEPLKPFERVTGNDAVTNQLNYPVDTIAVDPRAGSHTMLVAVLGFGIQRTANADVDPTGGPRTKCPTPPPPAPVGGCFEHPVAGTATWSAVFGPVATPIVSVAFSPSEPRKAYALDQSGHAFVLGDVDDDHATFQPAGHFVVVGGDFARQILVDPRTPGRLFALTEQRLHVSTDGNAAVWNRIGQATLPAPRLHSICFHPTRSKVLYLSTETDVLVSTDSGSTWSTIGGSLPNAPVMQVFTNSTHLYAVTFGRGLWRTKLPS